jgi:hypothetical protein
MLTTTRPRCDVHHMQCGLYRDTPGYFDRERSHSANPFSIATQTLCSRPRSPIPPPRPAWLRLSHGRLPKVCLMNCCVFYDAPLTRGYYRSLGSGVARCFLNELYA